MLCEGSITSPMCWSSNQDTQLALFLAKGALCPSTPTMSTLSLGALSLPGFDGLECGLTADYRVLSKERTNRATRRSLDGKYLLSLRPELAKPPVCARLLPVLGSPLYSASCSGDLVAFLAEFPFFEDSYLTRRG